MINKTIKTCSFFGHRNTEVTDELKQKIKEIIEELILNYNVLNYLFGSRSKFDSLCHLVVTELKEKYRDIKRIGYPCKSETCVMESEIKNCQAIYSCLQKKDVYLLAVDEEFEFDTKYVAGKSSYIQRNYAMINDSDYCIFFYDKNYEPDMRKYSKKSTGYYKPKSGTALAYDYARQNGKILINVVGFDKNIS